MARFSARLISPSRVMRVGLPEPVSTRWASPSMLPRLSGSGWTWETKVTRGASCSPARNRSDRRRPVGLPFRGVSRSAHRARHGLRSSPVRGPAAYAAVMYIHPVYGPGRATPFFYPLCPPAKHGSFGAGAGMIEN